VVRSLAIIGAVLGVTLMTSPSAGARGDENGDRVREALAALEPLLGTWVGEGFVRGAAGQAETRTGTRWVIERGFDGRFVRMEFTLLGEDGSPRGEWAGYFTFNPADGLYHTTWTLVSAGRDFTFHETGSFDGARRALVLVSQQKRSGPDGPLTKVDSVFTVTGADSFVVEDTTHDPATGEAFVSLRYELRRTKG